MVAGTILIDVDIPVSVDDLHQEVQHGGWNDPFVGVNGAIYPDRFSVGCEICRQLYKNKE